MPNVRHPPSHNQAGPLEINTHLTLRTVPDLCDTVSLAVLLGSNGNSYTTSAQSDICIYTHILHNIETGQIKEIKIMGQQ